MNGTEDLLKSIRVYEVDVRRRLRKRSVGGREYAWSEARISVPSGFPGEKAVLMPREDFDRLADLLGKVSRGETAHPLNGAVTCRAEKMPSSAYVLECSDGRRAYVPEGTLAELVKRYGDVIEVVDSDQA